MKTRQKQMSNFLQKEVQDRITKKVEKLNQNQLPKRKGERSSGLLTTPNQREVSEGFWVPIGAKAVQFTCGGGAAGIQGYTCKVKAMGTIKLGTAGSGFAKPVTVRVPLEASDLAAEIFFQTSDPNGGYANWQLIF